MKIVTVANPRHRGIIVLKYLYNYRNNLKVAQSQETLRSGVQSQETLRSGGGNPLIPNFF